MNETTWRRNLPKRPTTNMMEKIRNGIPSYIQGAKLKDPESLYWLGYCHYHEQGVKADWVRAIRYVKKAALLGSGKAAYQLAHAYKIGEGIKRNMKKSNEWFQKSIVPLQREADNNDIESIFLLGAAYAEGTGVEADTERGMRLYKYAADHGNPIAMNLLAVCYYTGNGVEKDVLKAFELYKQAAEQGETFAQTQLGNMYFEGDDGVEKNVDEAIRWFRTAATKRSGTQAKCDLASCYQKGIGVETDLSMTIKLYTEASEFGNALALNNLAFAYHHGRGVDKDIKKAIKLYKESVRQGEPGTAQFNLAYIYQHGDDSAGIKADPKMAVRWYHKSIQKGGYSEASRYLSSFIKELKTRAHLQEKNVLKALAYCYRHGVGAEEQSSEKATALLRRREWERHQVKNISKNRRRSRKESEGTIQPDNRSSSRTTPKCVCCQDWSPLAILVHGDTGHACFCFPCALSCCPTSSDLNGKQGDDTATLSCCPICRASIDKVILLQQQSSSSCCSSSRNYEGIDGSTNKERQDFQSWGESSSSYGGGGCCCVSCGKSYSNGVAMLHGDIGHDCGLCYDCASKTQDQGSGCPECNKPIDSVIKYY